MKKTLFNEALPTANMHVHSPHSFSYFGSIEELVTAAKEECVNILGISDFNTCEGFDDFERACRKRGIFPSYGLEVIAIDAESQKNLLLANDPDNPGRVYLCAKGIPFPAKQDAFTLDLLERVKKESKARGIQTVEKLNNIFINQQIPLSISYEDIEKTTPSGWVRERHVAKVIAEKALETPEPQAVISKLAGAKYEAAALNSNDLQQFLRSKLLKSGCPAYVREEKGAFLSLAEAKKLFLSLGGIPAYPVLADGSPEMTDWEKDPATLAERLAGLGYHAVEFITCRNSLNVLSEYVEVLSDAGFLITAGTEHNSPARAPLKPSAKDCAELPADLQKIFLRGAAVVIAHQELCSADRDGFVDETGARTNISIEKLAETGEAAVWSYLNDTKA